MTALLMVIVVGVVAVDVAALLEFLRDRWRWSLQVKRAAVAYERSSRAAPFLDTSAAGRRNRISQRRLT